MVKRSLLIVDDHQLILDGISRLLAEDNLVWVKKTTTSAAKALAILEQDSFQYILLDISMPEMNGLDLLKTIKEKGINSRVIILTMHHDYMRATKAIELGADGYILKDNGITEIKNAIRSIEKGMKFVSKEISAMISKVSMMSTENTASKERIDSLSEREIQIARMIAHGKSSQQIANELYLSPTTVTTHRRNIFHKLNISKTASLINIFYENGLMGS